MTHCLHYCAVLGHDDVLVAMTDAGTLVFLACDASQGVWRIIHTHDLRPTYDASVSSGSGTSRFLLCRVFRKSGDQEAVIEFSRLTMVYDIRGRSVKKTTPAVASLRTLDGPQVEVVDGEVGVEVHVAIMTGAGPTG